MYFVAPGKHKEGKKREGGMDWVGLTFLCHIGREKEGRKREKGKGEGSFSLLYEQGKEKRKREKGLRLSVPSCPFPRPDGPFFSQERGRRGKIFSEGERK